MTTKGISITALNLPGFVLTYNHNDTIVYSASGQVLHDVMKDRILQHDWFCELLALDDNEWANVRSTEWLTDALDCVKHPVVSSVNTDRYSKQSRYLGLLIYGTRWSEYPPIVPTREWRNELICWLYDYDSPDLRTNVEAAQLAIHELSFLAPVRERLPNVRMVDQEYVGTAHDVRTILMTRYKPEVAERVESITRIFHQYIGLLNTLEGNVTRWDMFQIYNTFNNYTDSTP